MRVLRPYARGYIIAICREDFSKGKHKELEMEGVIKPIHFWLGLIRKKFWELCFKIGEEC